VDPAHVEIGWALGGYGYKLYKSGAAKAAGGARTLARVTAGGVAARVDATLGAIYLARDLISTPTEDLGPANLAAAACKVAEGFEGATCSVVVGEDLLAAGTYFPQVHIVGRAATPERAPRLIDLRWNRGAAKQCITLVGKGVCYDTGGLSIKSTAGMLTMKKDMGGAAHVLALGYMIMKTGMDVGLRVLIPAVENAIGPDSYRPGDVIVARNNVTTEVVNTDAEGRLVLADALVAACEEKPSIVIDFATLTGAQRIALGADIPSFWVDSDESAALLAASSVAEDDLMWRLPLHKPYRKALDSSIADVKNCTSGGHGGAITAALYLKEFVPDETPWIHVDLMAFNPSSRPGRPEGGEAMGIRGVYAMLQSMFPKKA
jgi:leucyl aminopeptidase